MMESEVRVALRAAGLAWGVLALGACATYEATTEKPGAVATVESEARSRRGELRRTFVLTGELEAVHGHPVIVPTTPTWQVNVRWILEDGSTVEAGDKVIELDTTQIVGDVAQKRIAVSTALGELYQKQAEVAVAIADKEFAVAQAWTTLAKARRKAAVPEELVDRRAHQEDRLAAERSAVLHENAVADLAAYREASQREIDVLRIGLDKAQRDIERAEQALESMVLRAPRAGIFVVGENPREGRKLQIGDSAWVGMNVAQIPDLSQMRVRAMLSDVDDAKIETGMRAECTIDAYPDRPVAGTLGEIGIVAQEERGDSTRRYFEVLVDLDRADPEIMRPGMSVRVEVEVARLDDVLLVPRASLLLEEGATRVLLADGATREVELGRCNAMECEVLQGLDEGVRLGSQR